MRRKERDEEARGRKSRGWDVRAAGDAQDGGCWTDATGRVLARGPWNAPFPIGSFRAGTLMVGAYPATRVFIACKAAAPGPGPSCQVNAARPALGSVPSILSCSKACSICIRIASAQLRRFSAAGGWALVAGSAAMRPAIWIELRPITTLLGATIRLPAVLFRRRPLGRPTAVSLRPSRGRRGTQ